MSIVKHIKEHSKIYTPAAGYVDAGRFYESAPRITVDIANIDFTTAAVTEIDFLDGVVTLNNVLAANSGLMFPATATFILLSLQQTVKSQNVAGAVNSAILHGYNEAGTSVYETAVVQITEQVAVADGTTLGVYTSQIKIPIFGGSKFNRQVTLAGTGSAISACRLLGYWAKE